MAVSSDIDQTPPTAGGRAMSVRTALAVGAGSAVVLSALPLVLSPYSLILVCYALVLSIACLGLNLLLGTTGLLSFGHAAYFGVGAYVGSFLYRFHDVTSLEVYMVTGVLGSVALAAVLGFLCVRATRIHFTILTLAFAQMVYSLFITGAIFRPFGGLGWALYLLGSGGLYIPRLTMLGIEIGPEAFIPVFYGVIAASFLGSAFLLWRITRSPFGKALAAIRDNETRADSVGIPVRRYRWYAFILSGFFLGLAGALYGQLNRQITPEQLHWLFSAKLVLATVLGGPGYFLGPVLGAFAFVALDELSSPWAVGRKAVFGLLLIAVVFVFPRGIAGSAARVLEKWPRRRGRPPPC